MRRRSEGREQYEELRGGDPSAHGRMPYGQGGLGKEVSWDNGVAGGEGMLRQSTLARSPLTGELWDSLVESTGAQGLPGARRWLHVDAMGTPTLVEVDKHSLVKELGVRYRDLLTLDPSIPIPFPAAILIRPKALCVNLESVRMIICQNQCWVLSVPKASDPHVATFPTLDAPFTRQLCKCLRTGKSTGTLHDLSRNSAGFDFDAPYELRALEVALATVTNSLDAEVFDLEKDAFPTIDRLANNVSKEVLERVRQVKQVMGRLIGRVQRLKSELEEILDDDADMQDMYLARRAMMLDEEPPPEMLGSMDRSQDAPQTQAALSIQDGSTSQHSPSLGGKHASEAELLHAGRPASGLRHPASTASLGQASTGAAPHYAASESGASEAAGERPQRAGHHHGGHGRGGRDAQLPAAEHLGHHTHSAPDVAGGSRHGSHAAGGHHHRSGSTGGGGGGGGHGGRREHSAGKQWRRAGTVVRTTLRRRPVTDARVTTTGAAGRAASSGAVGVKAGEGLEEPLLGSGDTVMSAPPALSTESGAAEGHDSEGRHAHGGSESGDEYIETFIENPAMPAVDPHEIEDAEDLLESYYIQIDYIMRRLLTINERIDDTEDLVAIQMDHRRNELVATDLFVSIVTAGFAWVAMIAGIYGMNLHPYPQGRGYLLGVILVCSLGGAALVAGIITWVRHRRLMFIPQL